MSDTPLVGAKASTLSWVERAARVLGSDALPPLPTPASEEWHYTNLRPLAALPPHRDADFDLTEVARVLPVVQGPQVVVVNGFVVPQLTLLNGLSRSLKVDWDGQGLAPAAAGDALATWHAAQHTQTVRLV